MQSAMCASSQDDYRNIWNECISETFDDGSFASFSDAFPSTSYFPSEFTSCSDIQPVLQNAFDEPNVANDDVPTWLQSSALDSFDFFPLDYTFSAELPSMSFTPLPSQNVTLQDDSSPVISAAELDRALSLGEPDEAEHAESSSTSGPRDASPTFSDTPLLTVRRLDDANSTPSLSEEESDGTSDNDDDGDTSSDEDYAPSFRPGHRRNSSSGSFASRKAAMASALRSSRSAPSHSPARRPARSTRKRPSAEVISQRCKPRAKQVDASVPFEIPDDFHCQHCNFVQRNHRLQDFKRHVMNHYRSIIYWTCWGVPQESVTSTTDVDRNNAESEVVERNGMKLIGGCGRQFGRKDAYKRHLDDPNNDCVGDIDAVWHPGNAYKDLD